MGSHSRKPNQPLWRHSPWPEHEIQALTQAASVSPVVASVLLRAGIRHPDEATAFLHPRLAQLDDPFRIKNLELAVGRLIRAMEAGETIGIVGDYDVDGVTSTVLLVSVLRHFGIFPQYLVPRRLEEGYGLSVAALERLLEKATPGLVIALDCGTNAVAEVAALRQRGIDVIIIDHHQSRDSIPSDCILVNPHVHDGEDEPWRNLCTVGLVFKFIHGLVKHLRNHDDPTALELKLKDHLDLVALGTIADLVPLSGENRILTRFGLNRMQENPRPGIRALLEVAGLPPGQELTTPDVSFRLGPRINASGRLADAALPVELLLGEDYGRCMAAAQELDGFNRERQGIEREIYQRALEQARGLPDDPAGIVVFGEDWHAGVVGIVADRLAREFHRPAIVLAAEGSTVRGSGRSVPGFCLQEILSLCNDLLGEWGGHSMAVGVSMDISQVEAFRTAFAQAVASLQGKDGQTAPELEIAAWISLQELGTSLLDQLDLLHPFGQANPEPIFGLRGITLPQPPDFFGKNHLRFHLEGENGQRILVLNWNGAETPPPHGQPLDFALKLVWNHWQGRRSPRAEIVAWRESANNHP